MKKTWKRISAMFVAAIMLTGTFGTAAFAADAETGNVITLSYCGTAMVNIQNASQVYTQPYQKTHWNITSTTSGTAEYAAVFQYDLSQIPEGKKVTGVKWKTFYNRTTNKNVSIRAFYTNEALGTFNQSYSSVQALGYGSGDEVRYVIRNNVALEDAELTTTEGTSEGSLGNYTQWSVDMTAAVNSFIAQGKKYFTFVVHRGQNYIYHQIPYGVTPHPYLEITTENVASLSINGLTDGKISAYDSKGFNVSANVAAGDSATISSVVLKITDENNETQTYNNPTVNGNIYTWNFSAGLVAGTYTAEVTATFSDNEVLTKSAIIEVVPSEKTVYTGWNWMAGATTNNWSIYEGSNKVAFQHPIPEIPAGAVITKAEWYFGKSSGSFASDTVNGIYQLYQMTDDTCLAADGDWSTTSTSSIAFSSKPIATGDVGGEISDTRHRATDSGTVKDGATEKTGVFEIFDVTEAVKALVNGGKSYFGVGITKLGDGTVTVAKDASQGYHPVLAVTYDMDYEEAVEPVENHIFIAEDGTANASVTVNEGSAVLIVAAYNGDRLIDLDIDSTVENNQLTATLTNNTAGITFRSFVWEGLSTMVPLLPAK